MLNKPRAAHLASWYRIAAQQSGEPLNDSAVVTAWSHTA